MAMTTFERLRQKVPSHIVQISHEEHLRRVRDEYDKDNAEIAMNRQVLHSAVLAGKSGLNQKFLSCSFDNYHCNIRAQHKAVEAAMQFVDRFYEHLSGGRGFLFMGNAGTGKNHLAAAMANSLMEKNRSVVVMSLMDLLSRARDCYSGVISEEKLLAEFCKPDLLVIDEIGLQRNTIDEKIWLTRIIDKRLYAMRPIGFITNLDMEGLKNTIGERAFDRMREGVAMRVKFDWQSYRGVNHD